MALCYLLLLTALWKSVWNMWKNALLNPLKPDRLCVLNPLRPCVL